MFSPSFSGLPTEMVLQILSNVDDKSLFPCRLVSRGWCQMSSSILQERPSVVVSPWYPPAPERKDSLDKLIKCFKESRKFRHPFPYTSFVFQGDYDSDLSQCRDIEPFFALLKESGLLIKGLGFEEIHPYQETRQLLDRLIFQGAPHLRKLGLGFGCTPFMGEDEGDEDGDSKSTVAEGKLPFLKILQLDCCDNTPAAKFVTKILKAAPNLQKIWGPNFGYHEESTYTIYQASQIQPLIDTNTLHLVNNCRLLLYPDLMNCGLVTREKLSTSKFQPKVLNLATSLQVNGLELQQVKTYSRDILWIVKDIVEDLDTEANFGLLDNLDEIRFSKLRTWNLVCGEHPIFPPGMRHRDPFPKLENICICFAYSEGDGDTVLPSWRNAPILSIPSVHKLQITLYYPFASQQDAKECLETMTFMCPNTKNLELLCPFSDTVDFTGIAPHIWTTVSSLQTLLLRRGLRETEQNYVEKLEAGFTGFSVKTVRRLKATRAKRRPKVEKVEHLRVNPSILQMTELKTLSISEELLNRNQASGPFLPLSFKYAFNLMPGLVVKVEPRRPSI